MSEDRIASRSEHLLPEEKRAEIDDPHELAEAVLRDSDERQDDPEGTAQEHRTSSEASP
jgi:hypothetical protein